MKTEKINLKTFSNRKPAKFFDDVKIKVNDMKKDFVIEELVVLQICSPNTNQMVTRVSQIYPHLKNLRCLKQQLSSIDISIWTNFYHTFFTCEIIRG